VVIRELGEAGLLNKDALTANGKTIWENSKAARNDGPDVIMPMKKPFKRDTGIAVPARQPLPRRRHHQALGRRLRSS
jgi:dihydroxy-acid dehydratase